MTFIVNWRAFEHKIQDLRRVDHNSCLTAANDYLVENNPLTQKKRTKYIHLIHVITLRKMA